jgi:tellurite methyltransferase
MIVRVAHGESSFIAEWVPRAASMMAHRPTLRALDVAMGRGRHVPLLTAAGFRVFGVDVRLDALRDAVQQGPVSAWCADLTMVPLPRARFDLVLVTRYLQRDLLPSLRGAVVPGGVVLFETFTEAQRAHGRGPTSPDHLLRPGELRGFFDAWDVLFYDEVSEPDAVAQVVARRP